MRDLAVEYNIESINPKDKIDKTPIVMKSTDCTDKDDFEMEIKDKVNTLVEIYSTEGAVPKTDVPVVYTRGYIRTDRSDKWIIRLLKNKENRRIA